MSTVLVIEDSEECQLVVKTALARPDLQLRFASSLRDARAIIDGPAADQIDLMILDLMLPDGDGFLLLDELRASGRHELPVLLLTGKEDLASKVTAFALGAEDYLVKPMNPIELRARVEMRLRKTERKLSSSEKLTKGDLTLRLSQMKAMIRSDRGDEEVDLTAKEFKILSYLAQNEGSVFSRAQIVKAVWGSSVHVLDRTVDSHVCSLRRKLGVISGYVECIPGVGYSFRSQPRHDLQPLSTPHSIHTR